MEKQITLTVEQAKDVKQACTYKHCDMYNSAFFYPTLTTCISCGKKTKQVK